MPTGRWSGTSPSSGWRRTRPTQTGIANGLSPGGQKALQTLASLKAPGPWFLGDQLTLADLHAASIIAYFLKVPEGQKLLADFADIQAWWDRIAARQAVAVTEKAD